MESGTNVIFIDFITICWQSAQVYEWKKQLDRKKIKTVKKQGFFFHYNVYAAPLQRAGAGSFRCATLAPSSGRMNVSHP